VAKECCGDRGGNASEKHGSKESATVMIRDTVDPDEGSWHVPSLSDSDGQQAGPNQAAHAKPAATEP
jgi:hypothetical protein